MNEKVRKKVLREELKKRNGGKSTVPAKYMPKYPDTVEREYIRLTNAYMSIERQKVQWEWTFEFSTQKYRYRFFHSGTHFSLHIKTCYLHTFSFDDHIPKNSSSRSSASYTGLINRSICTNTEEKSGFSSPGPGL